MGADVAVHSEHMEQLLLWSTDKGSVGAHGAESSSSGAATTWEYREQLCWSTWSSTSLVADTAAPLLHVHQESCSLCSSGAAVHLLPEMRCSMCSSGAPVSLGERYLPAITPHTSWVARHP